MGLSTLSISSLELRCLSLDERLSGDYQPAGAPAATHAEQIFQRWREIVGSDQAGIFAKRLALDGLQESDIVERLGDLSRSTGAQAPKWLADAQAVIRDLTSLDAAHSLPQANDFAFGPLLVPLIDAAICEIERHAGWMEMLLPQARASATRNLWQSLTELFSMPLYEMFASWRATGATGTTVFADFVTHMRDRGFAELFAQYPVLARVAGTLRRQWIVSYGSMLDRLREDSELLAATFHGGAPFKVSDLRYGLSDPHGAGDVVFELCAQDGSSVFYKPRSLASDMVVRTFLDCLATFDPMLDLSTARFLDRGEYGWAEGIKVGPAAESAAIGRYYRRAGAWLGCFHLLNASDMHMENVLASGENPVPIDFETILQALSTPPHAPSRGESAHWLASQMLEESVLAVGLLPGYIRSDDGRAISVGGLEASHFEVKRFAWSGLNTMEMSVSLTRQSQTIDTNLPSIDSAKIPLDAYRAEIVEGLRQVLSTASRHKAALQTYLENLRGASLKVRRVIRPTRFYYLLLRRLSDHRTMIDGVTWSLQTELIARLYNWDDMTLQPWKLFRQERIDLCRMTIPAFYLEAHRTVAGSWNGDVTNLHARDGLTVALARIDGLNAHWVERQCRFAATSLGLTYKTRMATRSATSPDLVTGICQHLGKLALQDNQSAAWLGLEYLDHRMMSQIVPIGHDLYNGNLGIALFLAAAGRVRADKQALRLAELAIAPVLGALASSNRHRLLRTMGCGGFVGVGSLVYGLSVMASLLPDGERALQGAKAAAELLAPPSIAAEGRFDLISGRAGAILSILKLFRCTGDAAYLEQALAIGRALADRPRPDKMPWASAVFDHEPLTGISHGASGYVLAFAQLGRAAGTAAFDPLVIEFLDFERARFDQAANNWADTRPTGMRGGTYSPNQWCYGATGIGYARLALMEFADLTLPSIRDDAELAVRSVLNLKDHSNDTLCCGVAGHADFLNTAGAMLGNVAAAQGSRERIESIEDRWRDRRDVSWDLGNKEFNLGLMRGLAGIGYAALRLEEPTLPRVLVLA